MKIIIAGSRTITDKTKINSAIFRGINKLVPFDKLNETVIISGGARGVDLEGENWAKSFGFPIEQYLPHWDKFGKRAGMIRNSDMLGKADAVIVLWDGNSKGAKHMMDISKRNNIPIYVEIIK